MRLTLPAALLAAALASTPVTAQTVPPPSISVIGTGEIERAPDFARLYVSVSTQAEAVADAVKANTAASEAALARLEALGVARADISTANFQVTETPPRLDQNGNPRKQPRFTATHQLRIVTRAVKDVGRLAGEILALDAMTFQSIAWGLDRSDEAEDEARRRAVADAKRQASVYADAAAVSLGALRLIADGSVSGGPRPMMEGVQMRMAAAAPAVPIVPPASVHFSASVRMEWEIQRR